MGLLDWMWKRKNSEPPPEESMVYAFADGETISSRLGPLGFVRKLVCSCFDNSYILMPQAQRKEARYDETSTYG